MVGAMAVPVSAAQVTERSRDPALDLIKWLALVCMVLDHLHGVLPPTLHEYSVWLKVSGRLAFPLFCLVIAANVGRNRPGDLDGAWRYFVGLVVFALLTEPINARTSSGVVLNVMFTLALGLPVALAVHHRTRTTIAAGIAALTVAIGYAVIRHEPMPSLLYGVSGVLLPAALMLALHARSDPNQVLTYLCLAGLLFFTSNMTLHAFVYPDLIPPIGMTVLSAAMVAPAVGYVLLRAPIRWQVRPVGQWMYPFYPLHFIALDALGRILG